MYSTTCAIKYLGVCTMYTVQHTEYSTVPGSVYYVQYTEYGTVPGSVYYVQYTEYGTS